MTPKLGPWGRWRLCRDSAGPYLVHRSVRDKRVEDYWVLLTGGMSAADWLWQIRGKSGWMPAQDKADFARALNDILNARPDDVTIEDDRAKFRAMSGPRRPEWADALRACREAFARKLGGS